MQHFKHLDLDVWTLWSAQDAIALLDAISRDQLPEAMVLRNNRHSRCVRFQFAGQDLLLKEPKSRNKRFWERMLSALRGSESRRIAKSMLKLKALGLVGPTPVLFAERYAGPFVTHSYVVYAFLQGRPTEAKDAPQVAQALLQLHALGYVRNDAKTANFVMTANQEVGFIDFKLKRPQTWVSLRTSIELAQFLISHPDVDLALRNNNTLPNSYWLGRQIYLVRSNLRKIRRKLTIK